uniref:Bicaudal C homolog 2 n=1 Tax=Sinocyclocheilus grahami TaxID=75366 RepID=A0A672SD43_SINGR
MNYPHVKVEGKRANVLEAKRKILERLETKVNKVTLKLDVTHTEHSHVIGKGGGNIKKVMEDTSCHIHFPDSNRNNNAGEKSNQVSIAGPVQGVESARRQIRNLQPLVLNFDLPVTLVGGVVCDTGSPVIQHVAQAFGVGVSFRTQPKLYCSTCSVRGMQGNTTAIKAACVLMELLLGTEALAGVTGVMVSTQLDVTSQQHLFLLGQNGANFLTVMHQTHTQIILPDLSAPQHTPSLLIQGTADGVCVARQQLMDCLPICLMFDLKDEGDVKPKVKQTAKSVVVKGLERNIGSLYEARRLLLGLDSTEVSMTTKNVSEVSMTTKTPVDPLVANNGITGYWINVLMQQLHLTETGLYSVIGSLSGKPRPAPPPGLAVSSEDGRIGTKGVESKLEKVLMTIMFMMDILVYCMYVSHLSRTSAVVCQCKSGRGSERIMFPGMHGFVCVFHNACDLICENVCVIVMQQKPVMTEVRTPTDTWSGLGFSKSMPTDAVKELRAVSRRCYKPYHNQQVHISTVTVVHLAATFIQNDLQQRSISNSSKNQQYSIDYQTFLTLSDEDLKEVGVSTFGARRKMILAITDLNKKRKFPETSSVKSGYLEGGASGRLPWITNEDVAAKSNRW